MIQVRLCKLYYLIGELLAECWLFLALLFVMTLSVLSSDTSASASLLLLLPSFGILLKRFASLLLVVGDRS